MSIANQNIYMSRASDPGPLTEHEKNLARCEGYLDYSDIALVSSTDAQKKELEKLYHPPAPPVKRTFASDDLARDAFASSICSCNGLGQH